MGMYDVVMVPCPECGEEDEFQSKSGQCLLNTYKLAEAPNDVLADVNQHSPSRCKKCGTVFGVKLEIKATPMKWPIPEEHDEDCATKCLLTTEGKRCYAMHHCKKCDMETHEGTEQGG